LRGGTIVRRISTIFAAGALALAGAIHPAPAQERPDYAKPLSALQASELRASIKRLSSQLGVREATLNAIADKLGRSPANTSFDTLIRIVGQKAEEAAALQKQLADLRRQIAALQDAQLRSPAEAALARAVQAFEEGRLDDADRELAALSVLRHSEMVATREAWIGAVRARAQIARIQLEFARAASLQRDAESELRRLTMQLMRERWLLMVGAVDDEATQAEFAGDAEALRRAIDSYRLEVMPLAPRSERPDDWAETQIHLGSRLRILGERQSDPELMQEAITAFNGALEVHTRELSPLGWARIQQDLGIVFETLGEWQGSAELLESASDQYRHALEVYTPSTTPVAWSTVQSDLGLSLLSLGQLRGDVSILDQAVAAFEAALTVYSPGDQPAEWAMATNNLGLAKAAMADRTRRPELLNDALNAYHSALKVYTRERRPFHWAMVQGNIGNSLASAGEWQGRDGRKALEDAVTAYESALEVVSASQSRWVWGTLQNNLGTVYRRLGLLLSDPALVGEAIDAFQLALQVRNQADLPADWAQSVHNLGLAQASKAEMTASCPTARVALKSFADVRAAFPTLADRERFVTEREWDEANSLVARLCR
jgi:tetratricopeptide (TPR) repeat protein